MVRDLIYQDKFNPWTMPNVMPFDAFGWNSTVPEFATVINDLKPNLIVEVGSWFGASARHMVELARAYNPSVEVVCVDTWLGSVEHWHNSALVTGKLVFGHPILIYQQFISNVIHAKMENNITPFPIDSINGGHTLKRLGVLADLVYIDAGHEYESVMLDLKIYKDIVRPGGIMLIDDAHYGPIQQAVVEVFGIAAQRHGSKFIWTNV